MIDIKKQYLLKFASVIQQMPEDNKEYIYHSQYIQIAEAAQKTRKYKLANQYYKSEKPGRFVHKRTTEKNCILGTELD